MKHKMPNATSALLLLLTLISCGGEKKQGQNSASGASEKNIFPKGELGPSTTFTGNAYNGLHSRSWDI